MKLSEELLAILTCPVSGSKLIYNQEANTLTSEKSNLVYPIVDGIPLLLESQAIKLERIKNKETKEA
ncbi:MAG: Trm112 family protein [Rickettsiaceae bacterium]|nr:Trm112 family protein [Rickettsiaceae bacterium]